MIKISKQLRTFTSIVFLSILCVGVFVPTYMYAASEVQTTGAGLVSKVAPGEFLPISVKLLNFGNGNRIDVTLNYKIVDSSGREIYNANETVAVETTATFVKTIQIPFNTAPGQYTAQSSLFYQDQVAPATTQFSFTVERKIFGLYQSDFYLYGIIVLIFGGITGGIGFYWIKKRRSVRLSPEQYPETPSNDRIYYEILSDTIMQMRMRVGDDAIVIAENIQGLKIDKETGRVLVLTGPPSKVIATLVSEYEKLLGKKVSFSLRQPETKL